MNGAVDWTFSAVTADFNGDGWPDIFIAHHWHPGHMYLNNHDGTFREVDASYFKKITNGTTTRPLTSTATACSTCSAPSEPTAAPS